MSATLPTDPTILANSQRKTSRRQWSVQGGPRGLLQRMRSQLAEDGCPESQLVMGRTLLQQLDEDQDTTEEDARLAVFWLTQASLQGNKEATELLENCLANNIGICDHNYREIRECLAMDLQEKLARRAAHLMFCSLSNGNDFISSSSLSKKVHNLVNGIEEEEKSTENNQDKSDKVNNLEERYGGERFTEDHLVSAAVLYCEGCVPPLHYYITPTSSSTRSHLLKTIMLPAHLTLNIYRSCLHFLGATLTHFFFRMISLASPMCTLVMLILLSSVILLVGTTQVYLVLPVVVSGIALTVMIVATAHTLLNRKHFDSFHLWSLIFSHYCPEVDVAKIERKFKTRCWKPYATLFMALFFYLGTIPLIPSNVLISYLPALYVCSVLTLLFVPERLRVCYFLSLALYLSSVTPQMYNAVSSCILPLVSKAGLESILASHQIYIGESVKLNLSVMSILRMVWCSCCGAVLLKYGIVFLMPHLVSLTWCHLSVMAMQVVTEGSSLWSPVAAWSVLVMLPFVTPFMVTVVPSLILGSVCLKLGYELYTVALILVGGIAVTWVLKHWWPSFTIFCKILLISGILVQVLDPSMIPKMPKVKHSNLMWEHYKNACWPSKDTSAATVHRCLPLQGALVNWRGSITQVEITKVWNLPQTLLSVLPELVEKPWRCYIGKRTNLCTSNKLAVGQSDQCHLLQNALGSNECTLDNWNEYTFEITLAMSSSSWKFGSGTSLIKILADNVFSEFALRLQLGDEVEFIGALDRNVGSLTPGLLLSSIKCINCKSELVPLNKHTLPSKHNPWIAPTFIFNFLMGPVLTI